MGRCLFGGFDCIPFYFLPFALFLEGEFLREEFLERILERRDWDENS